LYKTYPKNKKIPLEQVTDLSKMKLSEAIQKRKSIRDFSDKPISKKFLSHLLWASTGIQRIEQGYEYRTAPSAGALYPIETYLVVNNVESIEQGIYHYDIQNHQLEQLKQGDFGSDISNAALGQTMCHDAAVVFIWTAIFNRSKWKYDQRAFRYIYLDAGHIAENLALVSTALELGSCQVGALFDDEVNKLISIDGKEESVVYMTAVGNPIK
jgi:SagB-type dehydrogenase family enzyme